MNRFGICDWGFRIDEGDVIDIVSFGYELSAMSYQLALKVPKPVTRNP